MKACINKHGSALIMIASGGMEIPAPTAVINPSFITMFLFQFFCRGLNNRCIVMHMCDPLALPVAFILAELIASQSKARQKDTPK